MTLERTIRELNEAVKLDQETVQKYFPKIKDKNVLKHLTDFVVPPTPPEGEIKPFRVKYFLFLSFS